jgi:hypothetical protein
MQSERVSSLKHSVVASFVHILTLDFIQLSQIWGYICGVNGVSVHPYAHPSQQKLIKNL